eukprot:PhM_4_TR5147/c0_g1_i1/m.75480/K06950/K06950; uncharacterized protein
MHCTLYFIFFNLAFLRLMVFDRATELTRRVLEDAKVDESHGIGHALEVVGHANRAIEADSDLTPEQRLVVQLAALLHDVDDRKFFPDNKNYENARGVLNELDVSDAVKDDVIRSISMVSCSTNGNSMSVGGKDMYLLYPRFCDRLEAIGEVGVERCLAYNNLSGRPMFAETTALPTTPEELAAVACDARLDEYMARKTSDSFLDHFFDKLLHVGKPGAMGTCENKYLLSEAEARHGYMINFVLKACCEEKARRNL